MNKELPKMYQNKINKTINNTQKVFNSMENNMERGIKETKTEKQKYSNIPITKKIDNIFNSYDYVYKASVTIVTDTETIKKTIVARDNNNLITINNEYIPISIIRDIYK